ncbi:MAG: DUF3052 domain-containing protein [Chloroflexota bacterium]
MSAEGAGYSKRPLADKLGIKAGMRVAVIHAPDGYPALDEVEQVELSAKSLDFIHLFTKSRAELDAQFPKLKAALTPNGILWLSWPKKAAKVETDLDENIIRDTGLAIGLVDVKVAAVDSVWSGLKFVYRLKDR